MNKIPNSSKIQTLNEQISVWIESARQIGGHESKLRAYWMIGRLIAAEVDEWDVWLDYLADTLETKYGSACRSLNLRRMRSFFMTYPSWNKVSCELSWSHYRKLLKIEDSVRREFYRKEAVASQWSAVELGRQIRSMAYDRLLENGPGPVHPEKVLKDPYVLEFLDLGYPSGFMEKDLETALLDKLQHFLLELGTGFAFVARQKRVVTDSGKPFYIDLVFYHFQLKCFVLIDLKTGELTHGDIGQMDMYVRLYEEKYRSPDDQPTVGMILCSKKDRTIIRYSILQDSRQLFASTYLLHLPSEKELSEKILHDRRELLDTPF